MAKNQTNNSTNRTTNRTTDTTQKTTNRTQQKKTTNRTTNTTDSKKASVGRAGTAPPGFGAQPVGGSGARGLKLPPAGG